MTPTKETANSENYKAQHGLDITQKDDIKLT